MLVKDEQQQKFLLYFSSSHADTRKVKETECDVTVEANPRSYDPAT
jgi:hypothetical protein